MVFLHFVPHPLQIYPSETQSVMLPCDSALSDIALTFDHLLRQDTFIFRVEGTGVLRPDEVVSMALEWMQQKMLMLNAALQSNAGDDAMLE